MTGQEKGDLLIQVTP